MTNVIKLSHSTITARDAHNRLKQVIEREGLTDFQMNQISVAFFKGRHWSALSTSDKKYVTALIKQGTFKFDKPAPDYPDEPDDEPA